MNRRNVPSPIEANKSELGDPIARLVAHDLNEAVTHLTLVRISYLVPTIHYLGGNTAADTPENVNKLIAAPNNAASVPRIVRIADPAFRRQ
jgi:hypothetical protein